MGADRSAGHFRKADQCLRVAKRCDDPAVRACWAELASRHMLLALQARSRVVPQQPAAEPRFPPRF